MKRSAGILLYRRKADELEVLLVHPGGPFWAGKDSGAWSIPKGEFRDGEDPLAAAKRELMEELDFELDSRSRLVALSPVRQKGGKEVHAWAVEGDFDAMGIRSNTFELEWPPKSGQIRTYPEVDRAEWFGLDTAATKINSAQIAFLRELENLTEQ